MAIPTWGDIKNRWAKVVGHRIPARCALIYYETAHAEYVSQKGQVAGQGNAEIEGLIKELEDKFRATGEKATMGDAVLYERLVAHNLPLAVIRRKVLNTRWRFRQVVSPETYQAYEATSPPNPINQETPEADIRADLDDLLGRMQSAYVVTPFREEMRSRISIRVVAVLLVVVVAMCAVVWYRYAQSDRLGTSNSDASQQIVIPEITIALLAGAIGGLVSVQQRIQSAPSEGDAIRSVMSLYNGMLSVILSPFVGAISAGLLFLLLVGHFLSGDLFPALPESGGASVHDLRDFLLHSGTAGGWRNLAKLIIWAFIAGFAERLVPDTLTRIVDSVQSQANRPPQPVATVPPNH
jgi:hypothetical protein